MHIAVVGHMRSGTTVFRQWLGSPATAFDLGEVFHNRTNRSNNYWEFLFQLSAADAKYRHPQCWRAAWELFIEEKHKETGAEILIYDLKIGYFSYVLNYDGAEYKTICLDDKTKIIFLARKNIARLLMSRYLAERSNRWFRLSESPSEEMLAKFRRWRNIDNGVNNPPPVGFDPSAPSKIAVNPVVLARDIETTIAQNEEILRIFGSRIHAKVVYEDLFDRDGKFDAALVQQMARMMEISEDAFHPRPILAKQNPASMLSSIENAEEVVKYFRNSQYEWMFEDAPPQS
jgi:hypothetical protein